MDKQGYFSFDFESKDKTILAEYLTFISGVFGNEEFSESIDVDSEFENFISTLSEELSVCPDFYEKYLTYKIEADNQNDSDENN